LSLVAHDRVHRDGAVQEGLAAKGNEWISLQRNFDPAETGAAELAAIGASEISMRNQFRAWREFML